MNKLKFSLIIISFLFVFQSCKKDKDIKPIHSFSEYETTNIEGFSVYYLRSHKTDQNVKKYLDQLNSMLPSLLKIVPENKKAFFQSVKIWIASDLEEYEKVANTKNASALYHSDSDEIISEKRKSVEINVKQEGFEYTKADDNISVLIHEMSHAYHDQKVENGFSNKEIKEAYNKAKTNNTYANIVDEYGEKAHPYLMTNDMEFFAELSLKYLYKHNQQPFNKEELKNFDIDSYNLMEKYWR